MNCHLTFPIQELLAVLQIKRGYRDNLDIISRLSVKIYCMTLINNDGSLHVHSFSLRNKKN